MKRVIHEPNITALWNTIQLTWNANQTASCFDPKETHHLSHLII